MCGVRGESLVSRTALTHRLLVHQLTAADQPASSARLASAAQPRVQPQDPGDMFTTSSQLKHWMYGSVDEVSRLRQEANSAFIAKHQKVRNVRDADVGRFFLNFEEERMLLAFFQNALREFCKSFQPPMPRSVIVSCRLPVLSPAVDSDAACRHRERRSSTTSAST